MSLAYFSKSISLAVGTFGLVAVSNLILINSAYGFSVTFTNGGFESPIAGSQNSWNTTGDVTTTGTIDGINPTNSANQAIITTGYIEGNYAQPIGNRNDDSSLTFNQSGTNPVNSDTNVHALQDHLSLSPEAFSIDRVGGTLAGVTPRTSKEASGMYQEFTVTLDAGETDFFVEFDWSYLTNDGSTTLGGEQDFGFWNLGQYNSGTGTYTTAFNGTTNPNDEIIVLDSSSGAISTPPGNNDYVTTADYTTNGRYSYNVSGLAPGTYTYRVGFGVVDVDGLNNSSALLIDNVNVQEIPFEFSPSAGLLLITGFWGVNYFRRRQSCS